jgi:hypothetical protein
VIVNIYVSLLETFDSIITLGCHDPASAQWIVVCGKRLYNECGDAKGKRAEWKADLEWIV